MDKCGFAGHSSTRPAGFEPAASRSGGERAWTGECRVFPANHTDPAQQSRMRNSARLRRVRPRLGRRSASSAQCRAVRRSCGEWIRNASGGHWGDALWPAPRSRLHRTRLWVEACRGHTGRAGEHPTASAARKRVARLRPSAECLGGDDSPGARIEPRPYWAMAARSGTRLRSAVVICGHFCFRRKKRAPPACRRDDRSSSGAQAQGELAPAPATHRRPRQDLDGHGHGGVRWKVLRWFFDPTSCGIVPIADRKRSTASSDSKTSNTQKRIRPFPAA